ncbi:diheme cytochrome c [Sulfurimonas sp.]|uniref:diheme cytochrome c n=1 Tax=Sulfurimonas sp. TaxID=2022749 RepID=UPI0025CD4E5E|nr:diheme cytochrome c [Sulfurimonas sp.]MBW6488932.1 diheme cytochrome c [Sulfurimonas sp.]
MKKLAIASMLIAGALMAKNVSFEDQRGVASVTDALYLKECGSCHFAYQPGLLPSKSWKSIMEDLDDHFGTDASIDGADKKNISKYLQDNAADKSLNYKKSKKINESIATTQTQISITKTRYFIQKHRDVGSELIQQKEVKSISNCMACHTKADKGSYSKWEINIPNYGRWEYE